VKVEGIDVKSVTVDIRKRELSINDDFLTLKATASREKCIFLAYITAHTTIYSPMGSFVKGFTWKWLEENCSDILSLWGFSKKRALQVFWRQTFLKSTSWQTNGQQEFEDWLINGESLLTKIFIAESLTKEQRYKLQIKKNTNHIHLPADVNIKIIPDVRDMNSVLREKIPFEYEAAGTNNVNSGLPINNIKSTNDRIPASNDTTMESAGVYHDTRSAIQSIANEMPEVEEVVFVAYVGKLFADDLRMLKNDWKIRHVRFLLRDPDANDPSLPGEIPTDEEYIAKRRGDFKIAVKDIQGQARHILGYSPEFKYYRGHPCLRGLLVRKQFGEPHCAGFMSIYRQRLPDDFVDYAARNSPVIKLSNDNDYERILLDSFAAWFAFVWGHGSYEK